MMLRALLFAWLLAPLGVGAYPLDGEPRTDIQRLEGYRLAQEGVIGGRKLHPGARLSLDQITLHLEDLPHRELPAPDAGFTESVVELLDGREDRYGIAVLDLSDPDNPVYAAHRAQVPFNPGSVGKLAIALGLFEALARLHPDDIGARERVLKTRTITADAFIKWDSHKAPFFDPDTRRLTHRRIRMGDTANLWTWLDWMLSASSNAAASMVLREVVVMRHFGGEYPVSEERAARFLEATPKSELSRIMREALDAGVAAAGLDPDRFRQGGFLTSTGKRRIPGTTSRATPRELMRFLLHLEQGEVIDRFSSLELKRLLYMTQRRIRYASSPALFDAAVYFKSGSLYRCKPEPGFHCGKYRGNALNVLNSVAIVEAPGGRDPRLHYLAVVTSNVLKRNASVEHQTLATRLHRLIERRLERRRSGAEDDLVHGTD